MDISTNQCTGNGARRALSLHFPIDLCEFLFLQLTILKIYILINTRLRNSIGKLPENQLKVTRKSIENYQKINANFRKVTSKSMENDQKISGNVH